MSSIMLIFLIVFLGYLIGAVTVAGFQLGSSAVLLVALVFGHWGFEIPSVIRDFGLACFVGSIGFIAGPVFFRSFRQRAFSYIVSGVLIVAVAAIVTVITIGVFKTPIPLAIGLFSGALTSTPGLAAAIEATGSNLALVGYGIAYPFGVIGVVLFVQLMPKLERIVQKGEKVESSNASAIPQDSYEFKGLCVLEPSGLLVFSGALVLGLLLSSIVIPLPGGARFSLGISGGPLLVGLVFGHLKKLGTISLDIPEKTLETLRELGLVLFLIGAGIGAGKGFIQVLHKYGAVLFLVGACITLFPMVIGYLISRKLFRLNLMDSLGSICGGMTSTPALGALIASAKSNNVAVAYAATYPVALICVVLVCQFIALLF